MVIALFRLYENAAEAVDTLFGAGIEPDSISAIVPDRDKVNRRDDGGPDIILPAIAMNDTSGSGIGSGTAAGGLSGIMTGAAPIVFAGIGPMLHTGRFGRRTTSTGAGTHVEADEDDDLVAILEAQDIPREWAEVYAEGLRRGFVLIACDAGERSAEVRNLLNQANAADVSALREEWRRTG
jgi:hypothetical protein